jgi:hypothetical protein
MRSVYWLCLLFFFIKISFSCQQAQKQQPAKIQKSLSRNMEVTILNKKLYRTISSASGLEIIGGQVYVVGDDTPFLYVLNINTLEPITKVRLFASGPFTTGRIPKAIKPDLESMTTLTIAGETQLVAFGSGSAPTRNKCYTIKLPRTAGSAAEIKEYSLEKLYRVLQEDKSLLNGDVLNLEAAAVTPDNQLLLFQRSALNGPNTLLRFSAAEFGDHLTGKAGNIPTYEIFQFELPGLGELKSRFSGAYTFEDKLFFTASVENTTDAILDGEVMGSFVGWINLADLQEGAGSPVLQTALITNPDGAPYKGKVESLVIQKKESSGTYRALAITDNDNGESELLELRLTL